MILEEFNGNMNIIHCSESEREQRMGRENEISNQNKNARELRWQPINNN